MKARLMLALCAVTLTAACQKSYDPHGPAAVTTERLANADADSGNWLTYGRTQDEQRFSPLDQVNVSTVSKLGLAWSADMDTARGQEATPIVVDGVLYVTTAWSMVKAYDAATGKALWAYDPKVPREVLIKTCCDAVNRGVAVYENKVYVAALDGRLIALNAADGKVVWSTETFDPKEPHVITAAPRIVKGKVIIGNAGSEYITRGYVSAYDAKTGKLAWRF